MATITKTSGILDVAPASGWFVDSHTELDSAILEEREGLTRLTEHLIQTSEIEAEIRRICVSTLARFGFTSWSQDDSSMMFWADGVDATFRWEVSPNTIDSYGPPTCLLSVKLGDTLVLYASVIVDLDGDGVLPLWQAVRSIILRALEYAKE